MTEIPVYNQRGRVGDDCKLYMDDMKLYQHVLDTHEGKNIILKIYEHDEDPTQDQYAYYNGVVIPIALSTETFGGWTAKEFDDHYSELFLCTKKLKKIGDNYTEIKNRKSKSTIGKKKYAWFVNSVILDLLDEHKIKIPKPIKRTKKYGDDKKKRI